MVEKIEKISKIILNNIVNMNSFLITFYYIFFILIFKFYKISNSLLSLHCLVLSILFTHTLTLLTI
jgi:hypothetical protein